MRAADHKPDLSARVTIRMSKAMRRRVLNICRIEHLEESEVLRYIIDAGMSVAETQGIEGVMRTRRSLLDKMMREDSRGRRKDTIKSPVRSES